MLIGMTVVAVATSAPELLVSVRSAIAGHPDMAVGNVVGSNICNMALILGLAAAVRPLQVVPRQVRRDVHMLLVTMAFIGVIGLAGSVGRLTGIAMVLAMAAFVVYSYRRDVATDTLAEDWHAEESDVYSSTSRNGLAAGVFVAAGLAMLLTGAQSLIVGATAIARDVGVPEAVVGLTIVAIGTSLPELATSVIAAVRGHSEVAVGNVIGSNTMNVLLILGSAAAIRPISIAERIARIDIPVMLVLTVIVAIPLLAGGRIGRLLGTTLAVAYVAYLVTLYVF
jgi:cation:H+ antiporter